MAKKQAGTPVIQPSWVKPTDPAETTPPAPEVTGQDEVEVEAEVAAIAEAEAVAIAETEAALAAAEAKPVETVTVVATSGFNCRLSHDNMVRVEAGISEMDPAMAKEMADHWFAKEHGFKIYSKE